MGKKTFLTMFKYIEYVDFFKAIKKPLLIKKIGYAGKIKAEILRYMVPKFITDWLSEKRLTILSAEIKIINPDKIIRAQPYDRALK